MRRILPYILILTVVVQLFAPFSVGLGKTKFINKNVVNATSIDENNLNNTLKTLRETTKSDCLNSGLPLKNFCLSAAGLNDGKNQSASLFIYLIGQRPVKSVGGIPILTLTITDDLGEVVSADNDLEQWSIDQDQGLINKNDPDETKYDGYVFGLDKINGLNKDRIYTIKIEVLKGIAKPPVSFVVEGVYIPQDATQTTTNITTGNGTENSSGFPACNIFKSKTYVGCIGIGMYYLFFRPTSFLFSLTGKILDFSVMYSTNDESYRSTFVLEGWQVIRDFCNMFFIFVLLYIAIGTILQMNGVKAKEMVVNVVIIGLLINFSLFATQVIIDASNILTRVFYNTNTISIGTQTDNSGTAISETGDFGEIKLSEAIVTKVNPVKLITSAQEINSISVKGVAGSSENEDTTTKGISGGSFIIIVILTSVINVVGMIAFLTSGMIFLARVIGLWLAMILSPIAFFSYIVPKLQDIKMIGWKKWWPDTLKMAFLAPIFMFFMYLIVKFMDKGLGITDKAVQGGLSDGGLSFVIAIMVPFIMVMVLLMKAKDIAKDMSGELGQSITKGIATAGGVALGATAGGIALAGRQIIGKRMAKMSRGDTSTQKYIEAKQLKATGDTSKWDQLNWRQKAIGATTTLGGKMRTDKLQTGVGGLLNKAQEKVGKTDKARHKEDEVKKATGLEGVDNANLSGTDIKNMQNKYKEMEGGNVEAQFRKGVDAKGAVLSMTEKDPTTGAVLNTYTGESDFKAKNRTNVANDVSTRVGAFTDGDVDGTGKLTDRGRKKVEDELNIKLNAVIKENTDSKVVEKFDEMRKDASTHVNPVMRGFSGTNKNSFDIRKLSEMKTDQREGFLTKGTVGLAAIIAGGVRTGLRGSGFGNSKIKVEGDFLKDLGNTISDSLKNMKVNVDLSHVGEHKSSADAHGGGEHH